MDTEKIKKAPWWKYLKQLKYALLASLGVTGGLLVIELDLITSFLTSDYLKTLISTEMKVELTKYLFILSVLWATMLKQFHKHFQDINKHGRTIEGKLDELTNVIARLDDSMHNGFRAGDERMTRIEKTQKYFSRDQTLMKNQIKRLEKITIGDA